MARAIHDNKGLFSRKVFGQNIQLRYKNDEAFNNHFPPSKCQMKEHS